MCSPTILIMQLNLQNSGVRSPRPPVYCNHYGIYVEPFDKLYHVGRDKVNCPKGKRGSPGGYQCRAIRKRVMIDSTYENKLYQTSKFVGAVRYNVPRICAARSCRALR